MMILKISVFTLVWEIFVQLAVLGTSLFISNRKKNNNNNTKTAKLKKLKFLKVNFVKQFFTSLLCRVNGGVCNNNFVVQLMSDLTNQVIDRSRQTEHMTSLGTAFFAGLAMGKLVF